MKTLIIAIVMLIIAIVMLISASCSIQPQPKPPVKPLAEQAKAEKLRSFFHGTDDGSVALQIAVQAEMDRIEKEGRDPNATDIDEILRRAEAIVFEKGD